MKRFIEMPFSACVYFVSVHCSDIICDGFQAKIPDIEKCLEVVATLQAKKGTGEVRLIPDFLYQIILVNKALLTL
jgi:hypothetical protein